MAELKNESLIVKVFHGVPQHSARWRKRPVDAAIVNNRQSQNTNRRRESARLRFVNCCVVQLPCDSRAALLSADAPTVQQCGKVTAVDYAVLIEITELEDRDARVEEENLRGLLGVRCG